MLGNRRKGKYFDDDVEVNPMDGIANLTDIMLVLACGLMMAIVMFWKIDLSNVQAITDTDALQEVQNAEELMDSGELGESFESMGNAYVDSKTGKIYIVKQ